MNWRDGQPSQWGQAINEEMVDYDAAILAWQTQERMAEAMADLARQRIEALQRNKLRAELTRCNFMAVPKATGSCRN